jgi:hypothetical protein
MTKFAKKFITHDGTRVGVHYFAGPWVPGVEPGLIKIRPRRAYRFPASFAALFEIENNSDIQTDYFERDCIRVLPDHPLYAAVKQAAEG